MHTQGDVTRFKAVSNEEEEEEKSDFTECSVED
jgi:hypothetical protein